MNAASALALDLQPPALPYARTPQYDINRCQLCGDVETKEHPFVALLTNFSWKARHFVHSGSCHEKHSARCRAEREAASQQRGDRNG